MNKRRDSARAFYVTVFAALVLAIVPLPTFIHAVWPFWTGLVVIYWALEQPRFMTLGLVFGRSAVLEGASEKPRRGTTRVVVQSQTVTAAVHFELPKAAKKSMARTAGGSVIPSPVSGLAEPSRSLLPSMNPSSPTPTA